MKKIVWLLAVLTLMVTIIPLQTMPALLPVDYSIGGEVRRWGSKYSYLILPMVTLLITLLWQFLVAHFERRAVGDDKEAQGAAANAKVLVSVGLVMNFFFCLLQAGLLWSAAWTAEHFGTAGGAQAGASIAQTAQKAMCVLTSVMLILLGNILPKTRKNRNVGVRLPYSRYNDITWQKSNRFGGTAMVIAGLLGMVSALLAPSAELALGLFTVFLLLAVIATTWYSRKVYLEESAEK